MAYVKQVWQDRVTEYPFRRKLYRSGYDPEDGAEYADIVRAQGEVFAEGTPITAERLNHIENGIFAKQDAINAQNKLPYAHIADTPTVLPNPHPLTFGQKSYDGTASLSLSPADIGLGTVFNLRGSKASVSGLPSSGNTVGDVWYIISEHVGYVWLNDGTARWEQLGLPVDLSNYAETDGTFPGMTVGHAAEADSSDSAGHAETADSAESAEYADVSEYAAYAEQLDSTVALTVSSPFVFRPAGGGADVEGYLGSRAAVTAVYGNTLLWNQLVQNGDFQNKSGWNFTTSGYHSVSDGRLTSRVPENVPSDMLIVKKALSLENAHKYFLSLELKKENTKPLIIGYNMNTLVGQRIAVISSEYSVFTKIEYIVTPSVFSGLVTGLRWGGSSDEPFESNESVSVRNVFMVDLTRMFGSGNEPVSTEDFRALFPLPYYAYDAGRLLHFAGTGIRTTGFNALAPDGTAHLLGGKAYEIVGDYTALSYSTGEEIVPVSGIFTPSANGILTVSGADAETCVHLVWSGYRGGQTASYHAEAKALPIGTYFPDGMMSAGSVRDELRADRAVRRCGTRAYREGDESDPTVVTDGESTVFALAEPDVISIDPPLDMTFVSSDYGTEMLIPENTSVPVTSPMHADIRYVQNLRDKLQRLPCSPENAGWYLVRYDGVRQSYERFPALPAESGSYVLKCTVGEQEHTFFWETEADTE